MSQERRKFDKEFKMVAVELSETRENIYELFRVLTNPCRKCGGVRDEFSFEERPKEEQPH